MGYKYSAEERTLCLLLSTRAGRVEEKRVPAPVY